MAKQDTTTAADDMLGRLPWHGSQWSRLEQSIGLGRLHHAILLRGQRGLGKRSFAQELGRVLLCSERGLGFEACGRCRSCRLHQAGNHPDLRRLVPEEDKRSIGVEQVRQLIEGLSLTSQNKGAKLVLIDPADAMTRAAGNTLLKTLEEPPGNCVFVLVADRVGLMLPTVRSRCLSVAFNAPPRALGLAWLRQVTTENRQAHADESELEDCLSAVNAAPVAALALYRSGQRAEREAVYQDVMTLCSGQARALECAARWRETGLEEVLGAVERAVHALLRAKLSPAARSSTKKSAHAAAKIGGSARVAANLDCEQLLRLHAACADLRRHLAGAGTVDEQLSLELLALTCQDMAAREPARVLSTD